jgi:hypothetical protein
VVEAGKGWSNREKNGRKMQDASCRRLVRIRRSVDLNAVACSFLVTQFAIGAITEFDSFVGIPCFLFYKGVFQLMLKVWCGAYGVASEFGFSDLECDFLFRWFLSGGVLDDEEIQGVLGFTIRFCARAIVPETGWAMVLELLKFFTQQGRLIQP